MGVKNWNAKSYGSLTPWHGDWWSIHLCGDWTVWITMWKLNLTKLCVGYENKNLVVASSSSCFKVLFTIDNINKHWCYYTPTWTGSLFLPSFKVGSNDNTNFGKKKHWLSWFSLSTSSIAEQAILHLMRFRVEDMHAGMHLPHSYGGEGCMWWVEAVKTVMSLQKNIGALLYAMVRP